MKKIILILRTLPHYRLDFLEDLNFKYKQSNIEFIVISGDDKSKKNIKSIKSSSFRLIKNKTFGVFLFRFQIQWQWKLIRSVLKERPNGIVMLWHPGKINYNILLAILKIKNSPYVLWGSGYGDSRSDLNKLQLKIKKILKKQFIKYSSGYICYGTNFAKQLKNNGYPENKICIAQNTIKVEKIYNPPIKFNRKYEMINFLFVGVLIPNKKISKALSVCKLLKDLGYEFRFDIVGSGVESDNLIKLADDYGLNEIVKFHGSKYGDDLAVFFRKSNVFLLPGTGGLAINEAMAYSLPVISTVGDGTVLDLIQDYNNGFLLDSNYTEGILLDRMRFFLDASENKLKNMEVESLKRVKEIAKMEDMVNNFYQISLKNIKPN